MTKRHELQENVQKTLRFQLVKLSTTAVDLVPFETDVERNFSSLLHALSIANTHIIHLVKLYWCIFD